MAVGTFIALDREYKREWEGIRTPLLGWDLQKMREETIRRSGYILLKFLHKEREIPSMSNNVVQRKLQRARA